MSVKTIMHFLPRLQKALRYTGTHEVEDVAQSLRTGEAKLWTEGDALIITQVEDTPNMRVLIFWLAAGRLEDVLALAERCYAWGRENGCQRAAMLGRKGWAPTLTKRGWKEANLVYLTKDL